MACGALFQAANAVFFNQFAAQLFLGFAQILGFEGHVEDLIPGANVLFRIAMTFQTPLHEQGSLLVHGLHVIHTAMTSGATKALGYMDRMIKIRKIGKAMKPFPLDRFPGFEALANRVEHLGPDPHLRVAVHTGFGRRDIRMRRVFHRRVAIAAINSQTVGMVGVTELDRLRYRIFGPGEVGGANKNHGRIADSRRTQNRAHYCQAKECVGITGKYLSHPNPLGQAIVRADLLLGKSLGNFALPNNPR